MTNKVKALFNFFKHDFTLKLFFKVYQEKCKRDWEKTNWEETFLA